MTRIVINDKITLEKHPQGMMVVMTLRGQDGPRQTMIVIPDPLRLARGIGEYLACEAPQRGDGYAARQSPGEAEAAVLLDRSGRPL